MTTNEELQRRRAIAEHLRKVWLPRLTPSCRAALSENDLRALELEVLEVLGRLLP